MIRALPHQKAIAYIRAGNAVGCCARRIERNGL